MLLLIPGLAKSMMGVLKGGCFMKRKFIMLLFTLVEPKAALAPLVTIPTN
jgi:hypothetical protein